MRLYYDPITVNCKKVAAGFSLMNVPFEEARVDYLGERLLIEEHGGQARLRRISRTRTAVSLPGHRHWAYSPVGSLAAKRSAFLFVTSAPLRPRSGGSPLRGPGAP
jgi:hypothetical protein